MEKMISSITSRLHSLLGIEDNPDRTEKTTPSVKYGCGVGKLYLPNKTACLDIATNMNPLPTEYLCQRCSNRVEKTKKSD
jgi:hypothetical protein